LKQELKHLEQLQQLLIEEFRRGLDRLERDARGDPRGGSPTAPPCRDYRGCTRPAGC
jgi:hypothetical protein